MHVHYPFAKSVIVFIIVLQSRVLTKCIIRKVIREQRERKRARDKNRTQPTTILIICGLLWRAYNSTIYCCMVPGMQFHNANVVAVFLSVRST